MGDCGFFVKIKDAGTWDMQHRDCAAPEAVLIVVRNSATNRCPDNDFRWTSRRKKKTVYACTQLNAQVGECVNDPANTGQNLHLLRKVPCSTRGAHQVNTRIARDDANVCQPVSKKFTRTTAIHHRKQPTSYCLNPVNT
ncbi:hypothetical protein GCM10023318_21460 [Nocardia callitridis]|uniref:Uncharacterized protein n=1 Tax=Nocardia callitridis TaxID=648753 RepID=A0ABP9K3V7_9NOCA